jgi:hypothetical protein
VREFGLPGYPEDAVVLLWGFASASALVLPRWAGAILSGDDVQELTAEESDRES